MPVGLREATMKSFVIGAAIAITMGIGVAGAEPVYWIGVSSWTAYAIEPEVRAAGRTRVVRVWAVNRTPTNMATPDATQLPWVQKTRATYEYDCGSRTSENVLTDWFDFEGRQINSTPSAFGPQTVRDGSADATIIRFACEGVMGDGWRRMGSIDEVVRAYYEAVFDEVLEQPNPFRLRPPPRPTDRP